MSKQDPETGDVERTSNSLVSLACHTPSTLCGQVQQAKSRKNIERRDARSPAVSYKNVHTARVERIAVLFCDGVVVFCFLLPVFLLLILFPRRSLLNLPTCVTKTLLLLSSTTGPACAKPASPVTMLPGPWFPPSWGAPDIRYLLVLIFAFESDVDVCL